MPSKYRKQPPKKKPPTWTPPKPTGKLPKPPSPLQPKPGKKNYRVKRGESWFDIARKELGDQALADKIVKANPQIKNLKPGMIIAVPNSPLTASPENFGYNVQMRGRGYTPETPSLYEQTRGAIEQAPQALEDLLRPILHPVNVGLAQTLGIGSRNIGRNVITNPIKRFFNVEGGYTQNVYPGQVSAPSGVRSATDPRSLQQAYEDAQNTKNTIHAAAEFMTKEEVRNLREAGRAGSQVRPRMVGESPLYQLFQGKDPDFIDPRSQHVLKMSDQDMKDAGYVWDEENGVWLRQQDVQNYTFNGAGAYGGGSPYARRGGGGGGGGAGGRRVSGAAGSGGWKPPPGTFGLVTWSM